MTLGWKPPADAESVPTFAVNLLPEISPASATLGRLVEIVGDCLRVYPWLCITAPLVSQRLFLKLTSYNLFPSNSHDLSPSSAWYEGTSS